METAGKATKILIKNNMTITFMESCTSGLLASMFTDTEGASAVFKGSLVTYSNEMKILHGVPEKIIKEYGVYSSKCAQAMAEAVQKIYESDISIGITGTTGNPDSANKDSVRGEAFFCIRIKNVNHDFKIDKNVDGMSRKEIKQLYANVVYEKLEELIS